jgi:DMSO reductase anchor subunit
MTGSARRIMAVVGGVVFGFALGYVSHTFVPTADETVAAMGGLGMGLGGGLVAAALVRD